jgi:hypothetical protein
MRNVCARSVQVKRWAKRTILRARHIESENASRTQIVALAHDCSHRGDPPRHLLGAEVTGWSSWGRSNPDRWKWFHHFLLRANGL